MNELDKKLLKYINYSKGFFIEVGANDGISQSNTYYFERRLNWGGILIEPVPELYRLCKLFRKGPVFNCALGSFDQDGGTIQMLFSDLMSVVSGTTVSLAGKHASATDHARRGQQFWTGEPYTVKVPVRALSNILEQHKVERIDLLSLDVEGYEIDVLKGINFDIHKPQFILIETGKIALVTKLLEEKYDLIDTLSNEDFLFKLRANL